MDIVITDAINDNLANSFAKQEEHPTAENNSNQTNRTAKHATVIKELLKFFFFFFKEYRLGEIILIFW